MLVEYGIGFVVGCIVTMVICFLMPYIVSKVPSESRYMVVADYEYAYDVVGVTTTDLPEDALEIVLEEQDNEDQVFMSLDKHDGELKIYQDTSTDTSEFWALNKE